MKIKKNIFRRFLIVAHIILLTSLCISSVKADGEPDPSFSGLVSGRVSGDIFVVKIQADGKFLVTGNFTEVQSVARTSIARMNADGSIDQTFNPPNIYDANGNFARIFTVGFQSDGKIIIGGDIYQVNGTIAPGLKRLNTDGSLDTSFTTVQLTNNGYGIFDIEIQPDDKIVAGGEFSLVSNTNVKNLVRFNADGTFDTDFGITNSLEFVRELDLQPDNKIIAQGNSSGVIKRYNPNGTVDASFSNVTVGGSSNMVQAIEVLADGKILIGGNFTSVNGFTQGNIARLNSDGTLDLNFNLNNPGAVGGFNNSGITDIAVRADGKIVIGGGFTSYNSTPRQKVALLNADGTLDTSFATNTAIGQNASVNDVEVFQDNKVLVGNTYNFTNESAPTLIRFNTNGSVDSSFNAILTRIGIVRKILQKPDGKIVIGGDFLFVGGIQRDSLAQLNADGTLDTSFVPFVNVTQGGHQTVSAIAVQPDGKILAAFVNGIFKIQRMNADGSVDSGYGFTTWSPATVINDIVVLANGQILVSGTLIYGAGTRYLTRLNSNGSVDSTFPVDFPNGNVNKIIVQPDGKVLIAGDFTQIGTSIRGRIARYNSNGTLDNTFNPPGGANASIKDMDLQPDGKIVVGGDFTSLNGGNTQVKIGRYNPDGTVDTSFAQTTDGTIQAVKLQPDGKILIGGFNMFTVGATPRAFMARLNTNGSLDSGFLPSPNGSVYDISLQTNNKILICGDFTTVNGVSKLRVARLSNNSISPRTLFDFDGDGKADISIFRPSVGEWWYSRSSDGGNYAASFGSSTDKLVPGDYTGDGRADIAIWRPSTGEWFILRSEDGSYYSYPFGTNGDISAVGDFDADGKADSAVFRPSDTNWYIRRSSDGGFTIQQFGASGDVPVVADYDGDGKSDIAIWRASTGEWWIKKSSDASVIAFQFGNSADKPVQGDYTGDGKADVAIFRPSSGEWFILRSNDYSYYSFPFGTSGDVPAPGDFDGDGRFDAAVFRPADSTWYIQRSTAGTLIQSFGQTGDRPVPSAFIP
ncbi:MAG: FG-GAP-like repeat-containing protein [Pyrinomonadaceae bacterium]